MIGKKDFKKSRILFVSEKKYKFDIPGAEEQHDVIWVESFADAISLIDTTSFSVAIFDFDLVLNKSKYGIKSLLTDWRMLPIIMVVSDNQVHLHDRIVSAGVIDVLSVSELKQQAILERAIKYVTQLFKSNNQLREYKKALHVSQKIANVGSWWWNIDTGEFVTTSVFDDLLNIKLADKNGSIENLRAAIYENDQAAVFQTLTEHIHKRKSFVVEFKVAAANGEFKYFSFKGDINKTWHGKELIYQGICREITTEKKRAESILQKSKFLEISGQIALVGGWEYDFSTEILFWTDETYKIHGVTPGLFEARMENLDQLYPAEIVDEMYYKFGQAIKERNDFFAEVPYVHNTELKWLQYVGRISYKNKNVSKVVGVVYDITEYKLQLQDLQLRAALLDNVGEAAIAVDKNYNIVFWNKEAENMFGYSREETVGMPITSFDVDNNTPEDIDELEMKLMSGENVSKEFLVKNREGKMFPVWGSYSAVFGAEGVFQAALFMARNISKEKEHIRRLEESELRLRKLFEHTPIGRGLIDLKTYKWIDVNNSLVKLLGYSKETLLNISILNIVTPEFVNHHFHNYEVITKFKSFGPFQMEYFKNDGSRLKVVITGFITNGERYKAWVDVMDITELDEKTESLRKSEERFRDYVENSTDVIMTIDEKGCIDYISPNVLKSMDYDPEDLKGMAYLQFIHPDDKRKTIEVVAASKKNIHEDISVIHRVRHNNGTYFYVHSEGKFRKGPTGENYGIIISRNIDEAYRSQLTIREQNQILKEIAFIQSHILRRPLANILGMLDLVNLKEERESEKTKLTHLIKEEAFRMDNIVNEIVRKSKLINKLAGNND